LRQAEDVLDVATTAGSSLEGVLLIDRQGGMRVMEAAGWSLTGLAAEFGAAAVFRIERRSTGVRVEGWSGSQRCLLESNPRPKFPQLPGVCQVPYASTLQLRSGIAA